MALQDVPWRRYGGRIQYRHVRDGITGAERFDVTVTGDGTRTLRACCELAAERLLRDVVYSVDAAWHPLEAYVRLSHEGRRTGAGWFRFDDHGAEFTGWTASDGRLHQRIELPRRATLFAPHPVACDAWQCQAYDLRRGQGRARLEHCANSSSRPDGSSGPMLGIVFKDLEYVGDEVIESPAGRFATRRYRIHPVMGAMAAWPPLEVWAAGEDYVLVRLDWELTGSTYELTTLEGDWR